MNTTNNPMLLPEDDSGKAPIVMGDAYDGKTPKTAQEKRVAEADVNRDPAVSGGAKYASSMVAPAPDPWFKQAQMTGVSNVMTQPMWFSPLHTPQNWQVASKRREIYQWCRFFYENEPKVAAAIDFYSRFPMNGFKLECSNPKILRFFEHHVIKRLDLMEWFKMMSSEYFTMGDLFVYMNVDCPICNGSSVNPDTGETCNHPGGSFSRITVLNPDWIEVRQSVITDEPSIVWIPDEELKRIVFLKQPKQIYDRIPENLKRLVSQNIPIPLSNRNTSHLKHMPVPYGAYGTSLIRRLFTTLAYKTKLMTANWIVAERLILPVRVVKIGSDNRPASTADIADVQQQLAATANDPNLTIVTHHNFEYEWYGATGKILQVTQEMEFVGKELLDGFMLNQSLLNGEMCIPASDRMLTKNGLRSLSQISPDDEIATFNKNTGELEYQKPSAIHVYDYDGDLVHFQTDRLDFACTPNHRMLFQKRGGQEWIIDTASSVRDRARFRKNVLWKKDIDEIGVNHNSPKIIGEQPLDKIAPEICGKRIPFDDLLKIVAYYVSEGHVQKETRRTRRTFGDPMSVQISQTEKGKGWDELCSLQKTSLVKISNTRHGFAIHNKEFAQFMVGQCGHLSSRKFVPAWIKSQPAATLRKFLGYLINGDGSLRTRDKHGPKKYYNYYTKSDQLRDDVMEIALKCGYFPRFRKRRAIWEITFSDYDLNQKTIPLESKKHETISKLSYKGKVWCVTVPNSFIISERNGKLMISGNSGYQSAQVGVETLIRRIESWRNTLSNWCEKNIFRPIAEMQGFIDEEKSKELGVPVYLYPTIKWNDLQLKDKNQWYQILMALHDKQVISTQTLMEELDLKYDQEVKRMRYEQIQMGPQGAMLGGGAGGAAGGMGGMGGGGAGGGMDAGMGGMGGAPGGMPMPGGMGGGGEAGGMGGAPAGGMGGGAGGPMAAAGGKIMKKGKGGGQQEEEMAPMPMIKLTKIEQQMASMISEVVAGVGMPIQNLRLQFPIDNPKGGKPFMLDFAMPHLKLGIESDGEIWHSMPEQEQNDKERDYLLAQRGWTILRFDDKAIEEAPHAVKKTISGHIQNLMKPKNKKTASKNALEPQLFTCGEGKLTLLTGEQNYETYFNKLKVHVAHIS